MTEPVRFKIEVTPEGEDWRIDISSERDVQVPPRTLGRQSHGAESFPTAPEDDRPVAGSLSYDFCCGNKPEEIAKILDRIQRRAKPAPDDYEKIGRYLFDTLIGSAWTDMMASAGEATLVELALAWDADDRILYRLPWEMMHGPESFLAQGLEKTAGGVLRRLAITRVVAGTAHAAVQTESPPKLLFVAGAPLDDEAIRTGAELIGLLDRIEESGRTIHTRLLENASPSRLKRQMQDFQPDVVHFICHGNVDKRSGRGYLELVTEENDEDEKRFADSLLESLRFGEPERLPSVVVLSACYSGGDRRGTALTGQEAAPLASELVGGGIPIVVGMSGRVSDRACRLFTRKFGHCLVSGESLVAATEEGRRTAWARDADPRRTPDWSYPAVLLSERVPGDFVPVKTADDDQGVQVGRRVSKFKIRDQPVFCGRSAFFENYYDLVSSEQGLVLAVHTRTDEAGLGRTRLLEAMADQAIRDGHIPILLSKNSPKWEPPSSLPGLVDELIDQINRSRRAFDLVEDPPDSQLWRAQEAATGGPTGGADPDVEGVLIEAIRRRLIRKKALTFEIVIMALREDLAAVRREIEDETDTIPGRALLLLDEVHRYGDILPDLLDSLGDHGLGTEDEPVPVVLVFSLQTAADHPLTKYVEKPAHGYLKRRALEAFPEGEDLLAYQRLLLYPPANSPYPGATTPRVVRHDHEEAVQNWLKSLRDYVKGLPVMFDNPMFFMAAQAAGEAFELADDEALLDEMRKAET